MGIHKLEKYENKKLIKHGAAKRYTYLNRKCSTVMNVKSSTPFVSALKRIDKMLQILNETPNKRGQMVTRPSNNTSYVTVNGMGKCISKVMNLSIEYQRKGHRVEIFTKSVTVLDEFVPSEEKAVSEKQEDGDVEENDDDDDEILRKRKVGSLQIHIYPA